MGKALRAAQKAIDAHLPEAQVHQRVVVLRPDEWFLRGVLLAPPGYNRDYITLEPLLSPLFVQNGAYSLEVSRSLNPPPSLSWPSPTFDTDEALVRYLREGVEPWLDYYSAAPLIANAIAGIKGWRHWFSLEAAHRIFAADGNRTSAGRLLNDLRTRAITDRGYGVCGAEAVVRVERFHDLALRTPRAAFAEMERERARNLAILKLTIDDLLMKGRAPANSRRR